MRVRATMTVVVDYDIDPGTYDVDCDINTLLDLEKKELNDDPAYLLSMPDSKIKVELKRIGEGP